MPVLNLVDAVIGGEVDGATTVHVAQEGGGDVSGGDSPARQPNAGVVVYYPHGADIWSDGSDAEA